MLSGIAHSIANFFTATSPFSYILVALAGLGVVVLILRRWVRIELKVGRRQ